MAGHELDNTPSSGMSGRSDSAVIGPDSEININIGNTYDKVATISGRFLLSRNLPK